MAARDRWLGTLLASVVLSAVVGPLPSALAQEIERVLVRPLEGNATAWVPEEVSVEILSPPDYNDAECCEDSDSGEWDGPQYTTTSTGSTGAVGMIWDVGVEDAAQSAGQAAEMALVQGLPEIERGTVLVSHRIGGSDMGDIEAAYLLTQCAAPCAYTEAALAFALGRGQFVTVRFSALRPSGDGSLVNGVAASDFHQEQIGIALRQVTFIGSGTNGDDELTGSSGDDAVHLLGGNDLYNGAGGSDSVYGQAGDDDLAGGAGNDLLDGGTDNDRLIGGSGGDTLKGGDGNDSLTGDGANAITGRVSYLAAGGPDLLFGGGGRDVLIGGGGLDRFDGGPGPDICHVDSLKEKRRAKGCETIRLRRSR